MSGWKKCDTCRKVRQGEEFDESSPTCRSCLAGPPPSVRKRAAPVTTTRAAPRAKVEVTPGPRTPLLGAVGSGDLEVRERRARRAAQEALTASHPDEFRLLLRDARAAEGLRPSDTVAAPPRAGESPPSADGAG